ncbi:MAG: carbamoyl phosphate synthase small subunit [Oscillospiraceae bacterium]|nr:carbamoyl phosphate synthase small subunit [Oscillospiraceae bacterium]
MTAYLILENGEVFEGKAFGALGESVHEAVGEVVFATGMTGYLETLTDPSYYGQIVLQTFPLIGNYGVIPGDFESAMIAAKAYIVKYPCQNPSNFRSAGSLGGFLKERCIAGLCGIDTRRLTRVIRENGVMNGKIMLSLPSKADCEQAKKYVLKNAVSAVSIKSAAPLCPLPEDVPPPSPPKAAPQNYRIAVLDLGAKRSIADALTARGCEVQLFPCGSGAKEIMSIKPDGIMLTNGPGDPADTANYGIVETIRDLWRTDIPIFGICLGHQLMALANGFTTRKLKFGHRGANQPVLELATGRVYITSQNHGYAVTADSCSFVNVNDKTCEGIDYGSSFSVQFHPEARAGPFDTDFLFDRFIERIAKKSAH